MQALSSGTHTSKSGLVCVLVIEALERPGWLTRYPEVRSAPISVTLLECVAPQAPDERRLRPILRVDYSSHGRGR